MSEGYKEQFTEYVESRKEKDAVETVKDLTEALNLIKKVVREYVASGIESFDELNFRDLSSLRGQEGKDDITRILEIFEKYNINRSIKISQIITNIEDRLQAAKDILAFEEHIKTHTPDEAASEEVRKELETAAKGDFTINKFSENNPKDGRRTEIGHEPAVETRMSNKMENETLLDLYKTIDELKESLAELNIFLLKDEVRRVEEFGSLSLEQIAELKGVDGFDGITKALEIFKKYKIDFNTEIQNVGEILRKKIKEAERMIEQSQQ